MNDEYIYTFSNISVQGRNEMDLKAKAVLDEQDSSMYDWSFKKSCERVNGIDTKRVEEVLNDSEEWQERLFELTSDPYYLADLKGTLVKCNKAAEKLSGYDKEEIIGKNFFDLNLISQKQIAKATVMLLLNVLGLPAGPVEFIGFHKSGNQIFAEIRTFPIKTNGKTLVLCTARDITYQKQIENNLLNKNVELDSEVRKRQEVERALEMSERKYKELADFLPDIIYKSLLFEA